MSEIVPLFDTLEFINEPNIYISNQLKGYSVKVDDVIECFDLAVEFLEDNSGSPQTFKSYRAEIEKFLMWCWHIKEEKVSDIDKRLMRHYLAFVQQPDKEFIGRPTNSRYNDCSKEGIRKPNLNWRPFVASKNNSNNISFDYNFSNKSLQLTLSVLSRFFDHLIDNDYTEQNPASILKRKAEFKHKKQDDSDDIKYFSQHQWSFIKLAAMGDENDESMDRARTRFLILMVYSLYPRISEVSSRAAHTPTMSDFEYIPQHNAYIYRIPVSKGYKSRNTTVSDSLRDELIRYRESLGFSGYPAKNDHFPLFPSIMNETLVARGLKQRRLRDIIYRVFYDAADKLLEAGFDDDANIVRHAGPHWLRHTGISHDVNDNARSLTTVRDEAGHSSIETTSLYLHVNIKERYESAQNKQF
jgi:site-specific recombinase XerD